MVADDWGQVSCWPEPRHVASRPCGLSVWATSGFFTQWQLGSKSECPKRASWKLVLKDTKLYFDPRLTSPPGFKGREREPRLLVEGVATAACGMGELLWASVDIAAFHTILQFHKWLLKKRFLF